MVWTGRSQIRSSVSILPWALTALEAWGFPSIIPCFLCVLAALLWDSSCLSATVMPQLPPPSSPKTLLTSLHSRALLSAPLRLAPRAPGQFLPTHKAAGYSSPSRDRTWFLCLWDFSPKTPSRAHLESSRSVLEYTLPSTLPPCVLRAPVRASSVPATLACGDYYLAGLTLACLLILQLIDGIIWATAFLS